MNHKKELLRSLWVGAMMDRSLQGLVLQGFRRKESRPNSGVNDIRGEIRSPHAWRVFHAADQTRKELSNSLIKP